MTQRRSAHAEKLRLMRSAQTGTNYKYGMGGLPKTHKAPKKITLATVKCLEDDSGDGELMPKEEK